MITVKLTENQVALILGALRNESCDDAVEFGEYSYLRCYNDVAKKVIKAGYSSEQLKEDFGE